MLLSPKWDRALLHDATYLTARKQVEVNYDAIAFQAHTALPGKVGPARYGTFFEDITIRRRKSGLLIELQLRQVFESSPSTEVIWKGQETQWVKQKPFLGRD